MFSIRLRPLMFIYIYGWWRQDVLWLSLVGRGGGCGTIWRTLTSCGGGGRMTAGCTLTSCGWWRPDVFWLSLVGVCVTIWRTLTSWGVGDDGRMYSDVIWKEYGQMYNDFLWGGGDDDKMLLWLTMGEWRQGVLWLLGRGGGVMAGCTLRSYERNTGSCTMTSCGGMTTRCTLAYSGRMTAGCTLASWGGVVVVTAGCTLRSYKGIRADAQWLLVGGGGDNKMYSGLQWKNDGRVYIGFLGGGGVTAGCTLRSYKGIRADVQWLLVCVCVWLLVGGGGVTTRCTLTYSGRMMAGCTLFLGKGGGWRQGSRWLILSTSCEKHLPFSDTQ